jgi:hypothetical protein
MIRRQELVGRTAGLAAIFSRFEEDEASCSSKRKLNGRLAD